MIQVGDETEGYCPRCRLNTYQIVAATQGGIVLQATCRTCRNAFAWKPEVTPEETRAKHLRKLSRLTRTAMVSAPEVISRGRKTGGDLDAPLRALAQLNGRQATDSPASPHRHIAATPAPNAAAALAEVAASDAPSKPADRWQALTAKLGWRDGKPYQVTRVYSPGDVVLHKAHGLGIIQQIVHESACLVLFRDAEVVLPMAMPLSALER